MGVGLLLIYCNLVRYAAWGFFEKAAIEYNDRATGIVRPGAATQNLIDMSFRRRRLAPTRALPAAAFSENLFHR
jgi:hypothetical protein